MVCRFLGGLVEKAPQHRQVDSPSGRFGAGGIGFKTGLALIQLNMKSYLLSSEESISLLSINPESLHRINRTLPFPGTILFDDM